MKKGSHGLLFVHVLVDSLILFVITDDNPVALLLDRTTLVLLSAFFDPSMESSTPSSVTFLPERHSVL